MTLTLKDIKDRLSIMDEITLLEILEISSEDLVERFEDHIELKADKIEKDLEEDGLYYLDEGDDIDDDGLYETTSYD